MAPLVLAPFLLDYIFIVGIKDFSNKAKGSKRSRKESVEGIEVRSWFS